MSFCVVVSSKSRIARSYCDPLLITYVSFLKISSIIFCRTRPLWVLPVMSMMRTSPLLVLSTIGVQSNWPGLQYFVLHTFPSVLDEGSAHHVYSLIDVAYSACSAAEIDSSTTEVSLEAGPCAAYPCRSSTGLALNLITYSPYCSVESPCGPSALCRKGLAQSPSSFSPR